MPAKLLIVDDTPLILQYLHAILSRSGQQVETCESASLAMDLITEHTYDLVITDWRMPGMDGMELLARIRSARKPMGVIVMTGYGDLEMAIEAMKAGADDFLTKPVEPDRLQCVIARILQRHRLRSELDELRRQSREHARYGGFISKSPKMERVFEMIEQIGPIQSTVWIHGETGTGKELVSLALHQESSRRDGPFRAMNCAALNDALLESELFGHEKGAFTGADRLKVGRFEDADGGTLLLDEIGDISRSMQAKLLRVLQDGTFERVGGTKTVQVDVRIIAATNKDLEEEVRLGNFRKDLFYRLDVLRIELPPLRERMEDVPLLSHHFLERYQSLGNPPPCEFEAAAMQAMMEYRWPGNIRELENAVKAAVAMAEGPVIRLADLPASLAPKDLSGCGPGGAPGVRGADSIDISRPLPELTEDLISRVENAYLKELLSRHQGNVTECARQSGLSRRSIAQKLRKQGFDRLSFKGHGPITSSRTTDRRQGP